MQFGGKRIGNPVPLSTVAGNVTVPRQPRGIKRLISGVRSIVDPGTSSQALQVVTAPMVTGPVVTAPVVTSPVVTSPVVTAPVVTAPVVTAPPRRTRPRMSQVLFNER